jgi:glycosyltransferase involved in cell wall biosynthesis
MDSEGRLKEAFEFLSSVNKRAYRDTLLISNQVLSKNPCNNNFLNHLLRGKQPRRHGLCAIALRVIIYYFKSALHFGVYLVKFAEYFASGLHNEAAQAKGCLTVIDIPFLLDKIRGQGHFTDCYLPGLEDVLKRKGRPYAYYPNFYYSKLPFQLYGIFKILKRDKVPLICEYQLLKALDLFSLLWFIIVYPFRVLGFAFKLSPADYLSRLLKAELLDTLSQVTFQGFSRYLQARRLASLGYSEIKLISWYENLALNKNFYRGLRSENSAIKIYGAKLSIYSRNFISEIADENEAAFGVVPDKIIVNGKYFMPSMSAINYSIGPSLRFRKLLESSFNSDGQTDILVLLPYFKEEAKNILRLVSDSGLAERNVVIKAHPATPLKNLACRLPSWMSVSEGDTYKLFEHSNVVIGAASGTLLEAASLGIPAISVMNPGRFDYNNPLPDYGRGVIWDSAVSGKDLRDKVAQLEKNRETRRGELMSLASAYKDMFFSPVTADKIIEVFEL